MAAMAARACQWPGVATMTMSCPPESSISRYSTKVRGTVAWYLATILSVCWRECSLTSQSELTSNPTLRAKASRFTPPYQPQPMMPTLNRGFESAKKRREPVATTAPAAANDDTKVRLFILPCPEPSKRASRQPGVNQPVHRGYDRCAPGAAVPDRHLP